MKVGYASADITPRDKVTLSGFAARRNQPMEGIDDAIEVHALIVEEGGQRILLVVLDLLALGPEILSEIHEALDALPNLGTPRSHRIFCCTHTHSAPATIELLGCGIIERSYWDQLIPIIARVASDAASNMRAARLRQASVRVPDHNYNRRRVLENGQVVMAQHPKTPIRKAGPSWDRFLLFRFDDQKGAPIAAFVNWAAHACTVCGNRVTGDFPAELRRRLSGLLGMPFVYLQGACGDLNPPFINMTREEMLGNVDAIISNLPPISWGEPESGLGDSKKPDLFELIDLSLSLHYQAPPTSSELEALRSGMAQIVETGNGPDRQMVDLINILNVEPGQVPDSSMLRYIAMILRDWADALLNRQCAGESEAKFAAPNLSIKIWRLGSLVLCFIAAESFVETASKIVAAFPSLSVGVVGYASPLVGYLCTDEALDEGGYEVDYAYRFYGHPAGYAKGSEEKAVRLIQDAIHSLEC